MRGSGAERRRNSHEKGRTQAAEGTGKENARLKRAVADLTLDKALLEEILRLSAKEKCAGCCMVWSHLRRNDWEFNHKRVYRIWKR